MVSRRILMVLSILLTQWHPVYLFPNKCFFLGKIYNCSWTSLQEVPAFEQNTEQLIASHNAIASINSDSFSDRYGNSISVINLDYNLISYIDPRAFKGLTKLESISLRYNVLEDLPASIFTYIPNVVKIYIQGNNVRLLHPELFKSNSQLKIIDISYNKLKNLPPKIFKHNQLLTEVYLNNNNIMFLTSDVFQNNPNLRVVHLGKNKITSIHSSLFHSNKELTYANFSNNEIILFFNDVVQQNCPREYLDISDNKLGSFELCQIQCFEKPMITDISGNSISCDYLSSNICFTLRTDIVSACDFKTPLKVSFRRKREEYADKESLMISTRNMEKVSTTLEQNSVLLDRLSNISESSTVNVLSVYDVTNLHDSASTYFTSNENSSDVFNETLFNSTLSSSEQIDLNMTTVITILQYDSPLVLKESTMRSFLFIGIECSLAGALVLKKLMCCKDKKRSTPVDMIELLSTSEQTTSQNTNKKDNEIHSP